MFLEKTDYAIIVLMIFFFIFIAFAIEIKLAEVIPDGLADAVITENRTADRLCEITVIGERIIQCAILDELKRLNTNIKDLLEKLP